MPPMLFVKRCLRIKDIKKPFSKRCKNNALINNVICKDCLDEAKEKSINILMHNDVTKIFHIPFKNQIYVQVSLSDPNKKPKSNIDKMKEMSVIKIKMRNIMKKFNDDKLKYLHDLLKLNIWDNLERSKNQYTVRYIVIEESINRLISISNGDFKLG